MIKSDYLVVIVVGRVVHLKFIAIDLCLGLAILGLSKQWKPVLPRHLSTTPYPTTTRWSEECRDVIKCAMLDLRKTFRSGSLACIGSEDCARRTNRLIQCRSIKIKRLFYECTRVVRIEDIYRVESLYQTEGLLDWWNRVVIQLSFINCPCGAGKGEKFWMKIPIQITSAISDRMRSMVDPPFWHKLSQSYYPIRPNRSKLAGEVLNSTPWTLVDNLCIWGKQIV